MKSKRLLRIFLMLVFFVMIHMVSVNASVEDVMFDSDYYATTQGDVVFYLGNDKEVLKQHYMNYGIKEGRQASVYFDVKYYLATNGDVAKAFGANNYEAAYNHFITYGMNEGRVASRVFDVNYYLETNGDVAKAFGANKVAVYTHFITYGMNERRRPSVAFDPTHYLANYKDIAKAYGDGNYQAATRHYAIWGYQEGRKSDHVKAEGTNVNVISELSCTTDGIIEYPCSVCKETVKVVTKAVGHELKLFKGEAAATCTEKGVEVYQCENCDYQEKKETEALGHNWKEKEGAASKAPTCSTTGVQYEVCTRCGNENKKEIPATGKHVIDPASDIIITKMENCKEEGEMTYTCKDCGKRIENEVRPITHNYAVVEDAPATCKTEGKKVEKCKDCGDTKTTTIEKLAHKMETFDDATKTATTPKNGIAVKNATCTEAGQKVEECQTCGEYKIIPVLAKGHNMKANLLPTPTDKVECGKTTADITYTCANGCGKTETKNEIVTHANYSKQSIDRIENGHPVVTEICDGCGTTLGTKIAHKTVATDSAHFRKLDNTRRHFVDDKGNAAAEVTYVCTYGNCGYTETVSVSVEDDDHVYAEAVVVTEPTCNTPGAKQSKCTICGHVKENIEIPADPKKHKFDISKATVTTLATCTTEGEETVTCSACSKTAKIILPVDKTVDTTDATTLAATIARHGGVANWEDKVVAPTCKDKGYTEHVCKDCGASYKDSETAVDTSTHDYAIGYRQVNDVTSANNGKYYIYKKCTICGHEEEMTDNYYDDVESVKAAIATM